MSQTIDSKVVEMSFDNRKFEQNVSTSLSTIEKLKKSLNFDGMSKGLDDLSKSAGKVDFSPIGTAMDTVKVKFSALQIAAITAMQRITNAAIDTGKTLIKNLSVDNIATGWSKFEQKTQSVGTLLAQGYDMDTVEEQLSKLAWFTDETSYEFTAMVESIAKFTAAGQTLPDSVNALMGVANWAALSGQNAQTASRAMYQLSQAMGAGIIRKEDYKSIQNVSMDTVEFRQKALDAAEAIGTIKKNADGTYTSMVKGMKKSTFTINQFAEHLTQEGWFTADVMKQVFSDYSAAVDEIYTYAEEHGITASEAMEQLNGKVDEFGLKAFKAAQEARTWTDTFESVKEAVASTWMQTFEIIFGNYEEAKELWTDLANELYDIFAEPGNERNEMLEEGLRSSIPYLDKYFHDTIGLSEEAAAGLHEVGKKFGYASQEFDEYVASIANGDPTIQALISTFYKIQNGATTSVEGVTMATDQLIKTAAEGNRWVVKTSEENIQKLKEVGDQYGYNSREMNRMLEKIYGGNYYTMEFTRNLLKIGKGLDEITASDIDDYLKENTKLTDEQITKLKELQNEYGANSDEINKYLKSLHQYNSSERISIMGILALSQGLSESTTDVVTSVANTIRDLTGATEESVDELFKFKEAQEDATEKLDSYIDSLKDCKKEQREYLKEVASGKKAFDKKYLIEQIGLTEEQADAFETLLTAIQTSEKGYEDLLNTLSNGDPVLRETIEKLIQTNDAIDDMSGRQNLLKGFWGIFEFGKKVLAAIKKAFAEVFPSDGASVIYDITKRFREFGESLAENEELITNIGRIFKGLFSVFKIIGQIFKAALIPVKALFEAIAGPANKVGESILNYADMVTKLAESGEVAEKATEFFKSFVETAKKVGQVLRSFFGKFFDFEEIARIYEDSGGGIAGVFAVIAEKVENVIDLVFDLIEAVTGWDLSGARKNVLDFFDTISEAVKNWLPDGEATKGIFNSIKEFFESFGKSKDGQDLEKGVGGIFETIKNFFTSFGKLKEDAEAGEGFSFFSTIKDALGGLGEFAGNLGKGVVDFFSGLGESFSEFSTTKMLDIARAIAAIGGAFIAWFAVWSFSDVTDAFGAVKRLAKGSVMTSFAKSVLLLAASLAVIAAIPQDKLMSACFVFEMLVGTLVGAFEVIANTANLGGKGVGKGFNGLLKIAISLFVVGMTLSKLGKMDQAELWNATLAMSLIAIVLTICQKTLSEIDNPGKAAAGAGAAIILVIAVIAVAEEIQRLAKAGNESDIKTAAIIMAGIMSILTLAVEGFANPAVAGNMKQAIKGASAAAILAGAAVIASEAIIRLAIVGNVGDIKTAGIITGLITAILTLAVLSFSSPGFSSGMPNAIKGASAAAILAGALSVAVNAVIKLALVGNVGDITKAALVVGGLTALLTVAVAALGHEKIAGDAETATKSAGAIAILASAMSIATNAVIKLALAGNVSDIQTAALILGGLGVAMAAMLYIISKAKPEAIMSAAGGIIMAAGALNLIAFAIIQISVAAAIMAGVISIITQCIAVLSLLDPEGMKTATICLSVMVGLLAGIMAIFGMLPPGQVMAAAGAFAVMAASLVTLSLALTIIAGVMTAFSKMTAKDFKSGILRLAAVLGVLVVALLAIETVGLLAGAAAPALMLFGAALLVVAAGFTALGISLLAIGVGIGIVGAGMVSLASGFLALSGAAEVGGTAVIDTLGDILKKAIELGPEFAVAFINGIGSISEAVTENAPKIREAVGSILTLIIGILLDSLLGNIPLIAETVVSTIIGVLDILIARGEELVEKLLTFVEIVLEGVANHIEGIVSKVVDIIIGIINGLTERMPDFIEALMDFVMSIFEGVIKAAEKMDIGNLAEGVDAVKKILDIMGLLSLAGLLTATAITGALGVGSVLAEILVIMGLLGGISQMPGIDAFLGFMDQFSTEDLLKAVGDIVQAMVLLSGANLVTATAMTGILGVASVVAELMAVLGVLGGIAQIPGLDWLIGEGIDLLALIGEGIGKFIGSIIDGALESIIGSLPGYGEDLSKFMDNLGGFIDGAKLVDDSVIKGVTNLCTAILELSGAELLSFITDFATLGLGDASFINDMETLGTAMATFGSIVSNANINQSKIESAVKIAGVLNTLMGTQFASTAQSILTLGLGDMIFEGKLKSLAGGLVAFAESLEGHDIDIDKVDKIATVADKLNDIQGSIGKTGGVIEFFTGKSDIGTFGDNIGDFAKGIGSFLTTLSEQTIDETSETKVTSLVDICKQLNGLQSELEPILGLKNYLLGHNDIGTFGEQLIPFIEGMSKFTTDIVTINLEQEVRDQVDKVISVARDLNDLQKEIEPIGGLIKLITGFDDLGSFGDNIIDFVSGMSEFATTAASFPTDTSGMDTMIAIAGSLVDLQKTVEPSGGLKQLLTGFDGLDAFSSTITPFATNMKDFAIIVGDIDPNTAGVDALSDITRKLVPITTSIASFSLDGIDGLSAFGDSIVKFAHNLSKFIEGLSGMEDGEKRVTMTTRITKSISELIASLPKTKGAFKLVKDNLSGVADAVASFVSKWNAIGYAAFSYLPQQARDFVEAVQILLNANYGGGGSMPGIVGTVSKTVEEVVGILGSGAAGASIAGTRLFTSYDESAQERGAEAKENIGNTVEEIGEHTIDVTEQEGEGVDEAVKLWGKDGVAHLSSDEVKTLFGNAPIEWIATMIGTTKGPKSEQFYNTLKKLAEKGSKSMTTDDILTLYNEGGIELIQALIDGGSLKAEDVTANLRTAIMDGIMKNGVLDEKILAAYFALGGKLDEELANGIIQSGSKLGETLKKLAEGGAESLNIEDILRLYAAGGSNLVDQIAGGSESNKKALKDKVEAAIKDAAQKGKIPKDLADLAKALGIDIDSNIASGSESKTGKDKVKSAANASVDAAASAAKDYATNGAGKTALNDAGYYYTAGIAAGIESERAKKKLKDAVNNITSSVPKATRMNWDENSPSKVAIEIGAYFSEGLAIGIASMGGEVGKSASDVSKTAIDSMSSALSDLSKIDLSSIDDNLTIRPVMDLSDVQNGIGQIGSMMNRIDGYTIDGSMQTAWTAANSMGFTGATNPQQDSIDKLNQTVKELANRPPKQITQNYTIVSDDPEEIYEYISTRMQQDVVREDSVWGS